MKRNTKLVIHYPLGWRKSSRMETRPKTFSNSRHAKGATTRIKIHVYLVNLDIESYQFIYVDLNSTREENRFISLPPHPVTLETPQGGINATKRGTHICKCFLRILMESIWNRSTFYQNIVSQHIIWYKNSIQDYNIYVCPIFSFPDRIPAFYAESWSLYTKVYVLLPKWTAFYSKVLVWVRTREHRPVRSLWGVRDVVHVNWIAQN